MTTAAITVTRHLRQDVPVELPVVAVIIPAYRAAAHIGAVLAGIPPWVRFIVVVDDCSPDETAALVRAWPDERVRLIAHAHNQGVGGAVLTGYRAAVELGAEILVKMDSDDQMDPAYLLPLIAPIIQGEADYTKGNRFLHAQQLQTMPPVRRIGNLGLSFLTKLASGYWNIFDPTNGYTALHRALLPMIDEAAIDRRYFFESSMLLELSLRRAVVRDVPIPARYSNEISSLSERKTLVQFPPRLVRGFFRRLWIQYFLRDFGLFSIFLISGLIFTLFGTIFGLYNWVYSVQHGIITATGTIMLSTLPIILGIQFLLQAIVLDIQNTPDYPLHVYLRAY